MDAHAYILIYFEAMPWDARSMCFSTIQSVGGMIQSKARAFTVGTKRHWANPFNTIHNVGRSMIQVKVSQVTNLHGGNKGELGQHVYPFTAGLVGITRADVYPQEEQCVWAGHDQSQANDPALTSWPKDNHLLSTAAFSAVKLINSIQPWEHAPSQAHT